MSGRRFQARAKTVQKLGRDGLVEQNKATGEEKRVSQRAADISFGPDRTTEQAAGHRAAHQGGFPDDSTKKRAKQPRQVQQTAEEAVYAAQAQTVTQEIPATGFAPLDVPLPDAPPSDAPSMRMAADAPLLGTVTPDAGTLVSPTPQTQSSRDKFKRGQISQHTPDAAASPEDRSMLTAGDIPMQNRPPGGEQQSPVHRPPRPVEGGGRLQFKEMDAAPAGEGQRTANSEKQQMRRFAPDAAQPSTKVKQHSSRLIPDGGGRLKFESSKSPVPTGTADPREKAKRAIKRRQVLDHAADAHQPEDSRQAEAPDVEVDTPQQRVSAQLGPRPPEPSAVPDDRTAYKKKQARRFAPDTAQSAATGDRHPVRLRDDGGGRLQFERTVESAVPVPDAEAHRKVKQAIKKRQVLDHAADAAQPEDNQQEEEQSVPADSEPDTRQQPSTPHEPKAPELSAVPDNRTTYKKRQAAKFAAHSAVPISGKRRRLQFEDPPPPTADHATPDAAPKETAPQAERTPGFTSKGTAPPPAADPPSASMPKGGTTPSSRKYEKAVRRVGRAEQQVEQARADLPTKRRLSIKPEVDSETGKSRRRLHFEREVLPEHRRPSLPARAGTMVKTAAVMKLHGKIREGERDNVALEAAHKTEFAVERGTGRVLRWNKQRLRSKPYRAVRQAERRLNAKKVDLAWQTALRDNPELRRKNALSKWVQKQKIKRKYAQAAREAQKTAQHTEQVLTATGKVARAVQHFAAAHKGVLMIAALLALTVSFFSAGLASCTAMLSGLQSTYLSATYLANEQEITSAEQYFTELETNLQLDIAGTEANHPGYDEYRYSIGEISHNPYELMNYLSAAYGAFTFEQVRPELDRLSGEKYQLTRTEITETRYDDEGNPYQWTVLQTTLTVGRLGDTIAASLTTEGADLYQTYAQTLGNRQAFGNPFDFPWLGYVSSGYGWRVHPTTGAKDLHRGVDIAVAQGTPIKAIQDGRVVSAGDTGDYGLCVVIEDEKGYQSRYAHCSSLSVSAGQEVKRGDVIAAVGSTGDSTGPHLHLEVLLDGEYLDPCYFVDTGDSGVSGALPGEPGGPVIPDNPGTPMGDDRFQAMLTEAEKYLGYPYVWGGTNPTTSFDCSGYVSWVINHCGVGWNYGRLGVMGLEDICTPVSKTDAKPGDLVFFIGTYDAPYPNRPTHVGIYVGGGRFIHCGDPISYANLNSSYWQQHFYGMGRLPEP